MMRGTVGMRLALAILSPVFLFLCVVAIYSEEMRPWIDYQTEFKNLYTARAKVRLDEATARGDAKAQARWRRVIDEVAQSEPAIAQVYIEDLKVADRCMTCHKGIDSPLFEDAPQPFRTHPGNLLKDHDVNTFGCTPCHQGQGVATTVDGAHGEEKNWLQPLLPTAYVQAGCPRCHQVTHGLAGAEIATRGADLFMEKGCYGCHDVRGIRYVSRFAQPLNSLKAKLADPKRWIYAWLKHPTRMKPDTMMPDFKLADEEAGKIEAFLLSLDPEVRYEPVDLAGASVDDGKRLFTERGCRGCHAVEADKHSVSPRVPHLAGIGSKVSAEWLDQWIADPKKYNPDTAMPKVKLTDGERRAVVAYLLTLKRAKPLPATPDLAAFGAAEGRKIVKKYECFGCHAIKGFEKIRPSVPDLGEFARRAVDELDFGTTDVPRTRWDWLRRKLRDPRAYVRQDVKLRMPQQKMTDEEIRALTVYVLALDRPELPARYLVAASPARKALRELSWMTERLNCNGCHLLAEKNPRIAQFFERKSQTPPTLKGVGARLQGQYMYDFLMEPKQQRPWLKMQMPTFGFTEAQAQAVVDGFAAAAEVTNPYTYVAKANIDQEHFQRGTRRFIHYKCVQCHPTSLDEGTPEGVDPDDLSINLMLAKKRLRPDWIKQFLARPKQISGTDTRMPTVFYTVDGVPKVEKPDADIADITTYLMGMTEPPEKAVAAEKKAIEEEEKKEDVDWTQVEY